MLWDVNVSILVDALNNEEAEDKVRAFLTGNPAVRDGGKLDYNAMVHCVDTTDEESLASLRKRQEANEVISQSREE